MFVVADLATGNIIQAEKTLDSGVSVNMNGKFIVPVPEMVPLTLDENSYVLPVDGGDVFSQAMSAFLVEYPMYGNVVFNPLMTAADMAELDTAAVFTPTGSITRCFMGRGAGPLPTGCSPNVVGVLPLNDRVTPNRPGVLITETIDISAMTGGAGADEFLLWWKLIVLNTTEDVCSDYGATSGQNNPAVRLLGDDEAEPAEFEVYVSNDDGATYVRAYRLTPTAMTGYGSDVRIAFINNDVINRRYIVAYAILF